MVTMSTFNPTIFQSEISGINLPPHLFWRPDLRNRRLRHEHLIIVYNGFQQLPADFRLTIVSAQTYEEVGRPECYPTGGVLRPLFRAVAGGGFTTKAMVCRRWEASNTAEKYISTEYVLSDNTGGAIHCIVRSSIAHCFVSKLEVGQVFSLSRFTVYPNKESYRLRNSDPHLIQLEGNSLVKKIDCPTTGFVRYPIQLVDIEAIGLNGNRFLIDVIGKVVNIGRAKPTRNGSQFLEFELMNERLSIFLQKPLCTSDYGEKEIQRHTRSVTQFWRLQFPSEDCHNNQKPTKWRDRNFLWLADEFYRSSIPLYLPKPVFCHGQLYVAISRVTDPKGLKILILPSEKHPQNYTRNIVYKEAFNNLPAQPQTTHKEI